MKAEIFFLASQQESSGEIESLLRRYVFDRLQVERRAISDDYGRASNSQEHEHSKLYFRFLRASMVRVDELNIVVADDQGNWCYLGGERAGYGEVKGTNFLKLFHASMASAFPAIAIMDRMVMVPHDIHEAFEKTREFSWFLRPLYLGGVLLVDFRNPESVREAARQVGIRLKEETATLCRRHMLTRRIPTPDFKDLARLLKIDREFLELHRDEMLASAAKLTPRIVSGPAQLEKLSRVILEIQNESDQTFDRVHVQVRGPSGTLKAPVVETLDFPAGDEGTRRIQFEVLPKASPYCPLEVFFSLNETNQRFASFPIPVIVDVAS
jgi:hypothetical protein